MQALYISGFETKISRHHSDLEPGSCRSSHTVLLYTVDDFYHFNNISLWNVHGYWSGTSLCHSFVRILSHDSH